MKSVVLISLNLVLCVLLIAMIDWFEKEEHKLELINKEHYKTIGKLENISQINLWLHEVVGIVEEKNSLETDESLIKFFDKHKDTYNLFVSRYIYKDEIAKNLDLSYTISAGDRKKLADFIVIENRDGFLQFRELKMDEKSLSGKIQVIHLYKLYEGDKNASKL
jgi:hypothetical protein